MTTLIEFYKLHYQNYEEKYIIALKDYNFELKIKSDGVYDLKKNLSESELKLLSINPEIPVSFLIKNNLKPCYFTIDNSFTRQIFLEDKIQKFNVFKRDF